jgi:hypothetical protein
VRAREAIESILSEWPLARHSFNVGALAEAGHFDKSPASRPIPPVGRDSAFPEPVEREPTHVTTGRTDTMLKGGSLACHAACSRVLSE